MFDNSHGSSERKSRIKFRTVAPIEKTMLHSIVLIAVFLTIILAPMLVASRIVRNL